MNIKEHRISEFSLASFFSLAISIFGFGYTYVAINGVRQPSDLKLKKKKKDDSISCQLANGSPFGIIPLIILGVGFLIYLISVNEIMNKSVKNIIPSLRIFFLIVIVSLVISLIWVSPYKVNYDKNIRPTENKEFSKMQKDHNKIAIVTFTVTLIYIMITFADLESYTKNFKYLSFFNKVTKYNISKKLKDYMYAVSVLAIVSYLTLIGIGIAYSLNPSKNYFPLFAIAEILFYISLLFSIVIYGMWWKEIDIVNKLNVEKEKKKKINIALGD